MEEEKQKYKTKKNPYGSANFLSRILFCFTFPLFLQGVKRDLTEEDIYGPLKMHESNNLGTKLENAWKSQEKKGKPSLLKALVRIFGLDFAWRGLVQLFIELGIKFAQPLLLSKLLEYFNPNQTHISRKDAIVYACSMIAVQTVQVLITHTFVIGLDHLGLRIRVAVCSLIYRKALRLSKSSLAETTVGQMVNLLSNDVNRFNRCVIHAHSLWIAPLEISLVLYLLYKNVDASAMAGILLLILFVPFQLWVSKKSSQFRLRTAIRTDERVRLMNEIISGIQVIKMYTWEKPFAKLVEIARLNEVKQIRYSSFLRATTTSLIMFLHRIAIYINVLVYVLLGNVPNHQFVFVMIAYYQIFRQLVTVFVPVGMTFMAETYVSIKRVEKFLLYEEKCALEENAANLKVTENGIYLKANEIDIQNGSVKWIKSQRDNSLEGINFHAGPKELIGIVGSVGAGKTTLLHTILKELNLNEGSMYVNGAISYASQEPWLFGGSIRQNILFGEQFDEAKYEEVVRVCALKRDFRLFPYGDRTLVGDRGVTLSGGQRARINLARAVYKNADIYLLDDPLSAVDTQVGRQLFDNCICGYLKDKVTILVTHQLQYLINVPKIYLLDGGKIVTSGTYEHLQSLNTEFTEMLKSVNEEEKEEEIVKKRESVVLNGTDTAEDGKPVEVKEQRGSGKVSLDVYKKYLRAGGTWYISIALFFISQGFCSVNDYFLTYWVNLEQRRSDVNLNETVSRNTTSSVDRNESNESYSIDDFFTVNNCVYVYTGIVVCLVVFSLTRSFSFFAFCIRASRHLHNNMFIKIIYGKMRFFTTNASGRILNRFSKDIGTVDDELPETLIDTIQLGLSVTAIAVLIAIINPWVLIPTIVIAAIFYGLRIIFLTASRDIKRLEGTTKSPVFSHLNASLQGLTTIRAFGAEKILMHEFDNHQNLHTGAYFMFLAVSRAFGVWLDLHCVVYTALVILSFLFVKQEIYGGNVGLSITQALTLTGMFQWAMRQWSQMENQMTSVERVAEYIEIDRESEEGVDPPKSWPNSGSLQFMNVSLRYDVNEPYVLKNLNFAIEHKEKIGIVGRTGAGKSSLIYSLFRLANTEGNIILDKINTKQINLTALRSKISIIPQEPVLFSGTLRKNLDPFDEFQDDELWRVLEEVELKNAVEDLPAGLSSTMSEGGSNFSVGQRQLLCLARAIIRNNRILVMDEATANVDPYTDSLIQETIRRKFADCTVLTIAHRLNTIMDSDKVLVMDSGSVVEFGSPYELLQNESGVFSSLVKETGKGMAEALSLIAEQKHNESTETN